MKRELTQIDKRVINEIITHADVDPAGYLLVNAFIDIFESSPVAYHYESRGKEFLTYYCDGKCWTRDKAVEILTSFEANIVDRSDLIQFLVDEKYISLLKIDRGSLLNEFRQYPIGRDWEAIAYSEFGKETFMVFRNSFCRVIITERLRRFSRNDFLTDEECLLKEAKQQTALAREQVEEAKNQSAFAKEQVEEARNQSSYAKEQAEEAKKQTLFAGKQVEEAKKQSNSAKVSLIISAIALLVAIVSPFVSKQINCLFPCDDSTSTIASIVNEIKDIMNSISTQQFEESIQASQDSIIKLLQQKPELKKSTTSKKVVKKNSSKAKTQPLYLPLDTINCDGKEYMIVEKVR